MKKIILSISFAFALIIGANAQQTTTPLPTNPDQADIQFEETLHDFGNIKEGTSTTYEFKFKNIGKEPLIILNAKAGCGCTTPIWPKEAIAPGKTAVITTTFNSQGKPGVFNKTVTVTSNAKTETVVLILKGFVETVAQQPQSPVLQPQQPKQ